jgi:hypothetical protein
MKDQAINMAFDYIPDRSGMWLPVISFIWTV